jgi:NitT/TauT family transport system substrate-binding protein
LKLDEDTIREIVLEPHQNNYSDPNKKEVEKMWNAMRQIGYIPADVAVQLENHVNTDLYQQAISELLEEHPDDPFYKKVKERFEQQNS